MKVISMQSDRAQPADYDIQVTAEQMARWVLAGLSKDRRVPDGYYPTVVVFHNPDGSARVRLWKSEKS
jgi:hypothetical protein